MLIKLTKITIFCVILTLIFIGCRKKASEQPEAENVESAEVKMPVEAQEKMPEQAREPLENLAPDFMLRNYDGKEFSLKDFRGKTVVLEWFSYACPFCVHHYKDESTMVDLANKYKDKNVEFLAINSTSWQVTQKNEEFAKKFNVPYPILDDRPGTVGRAYGATNTPQMIIINTKGQIVYNGAIDNAPFGKLPAGQSEIVNYVDNALAELTAGKAVTLAETKPYGCTVKYAK